jgi:hypothetical protein
VRGFNQMASWLTSGGFREVKPAPVGRRFTKRIGTVDFEVDLYSPKEFSGLSDYAHYPNFEKALAEHEIVAYDGHSMLGASDFWARPKYPDHYQVFLYGGCLGYEYYIRPILTAKGGWDKLDLVSSVVEVTAGANDFAAPWLAKVAWALDHGYKASWRDLLLAIRNRVGDSTFGASGVRENCFAPGGSLCGTGGGTPAGGGAHRYEASPAAVIPDNAPDGVTSVITVPDAFEVAGVTLSLDVRHPFAGDLVVTLEHGGVKKTVWDREGGSQHDVVRDFAVEGFAGTAAAGEWTLRVADAAALDAGTLNRWVLAFDR